MEIYQCFGGATSILREKTIDSSVSLVILYQILPFHNPEDGNICTIVLVAAMGNVRNFSQKWVKGAGTKFAYKLTFKPFKTHFSR
jgi:hypothetical protein